MPHDSEDVTDDILLNGERAEDGLADAAEEADVATAEQEEPFVAEEPSDTFPSTEKADSALATGVSGSMASSISSTEIFVVSSSIDPAKALDIAGGSLQSGTGVQVFEDNATVAQRFRVVPDEDGVYCTVYNVGSGLVLDVRNGENRPGAAVQQWSYNGSLAQKWIISSEGDGLYGLFSALRDDSGGFLALDLPGACAQNGSGLQLWSDNGTHAQKWMLSSTRTVSDGTYQMSSSVGSNKVLDIVGGSSDAGIRTQIYTANSTNAQRFSLIFDDRSGYYIVRPMCSGSNLDVAGGSRESGAAIHQWPENGTWAQRWSFDVQEGGGYVVRSAISGQALDVSGGADADGAFVQQYEANGTSAQRWTLDSVGALCDGVYSIACASADRYRLDIVGGSFAAGAGLQVWESNGTEAQAFEVAAYGQGGYYVIRNIKSGKYLTMQGGERGASIVQEAANGPEPNQLWMPQAEGEGLSFVSESGLSVDVSGASFVNGTSVHGWETNHTSAQRFLLTSAAGSAPGITDYSAIVVGAAGGETEVVSTNISGTPYLFLPSSADLSQIRLNFYSSYGQETALVSKSPQGSYQSLLSGSVIDLSSLAYAWDDHDTLFLYIKSVPESTPVTLGIMKSANVASVHLTSSDPVNKGRLFVDGSIDHSASAEGSMVFVNEDGSVVYDGLLSQIKGRGNSTWTNSEKKPYQIKLGSKTDLLETDVLGNKAKTWVLLANATDPSLVRNTITYKLAASLGLACSSECRPVDLFYDGEYRGSYLLCEKIEVNKGRVNITDLEEANELANPNVDLGQLPAAGDVNSYGYAYQYVSGIENPADITGGFLLELDNAYYGSERCWFKTSMGTFVVKAPGDASREEVRYISEYMQRAINAIVLESDDASTLFDLDSLAKTYLVNELSKNADYYRWSSTYFYKDIGEDSPLFAGPLWDYDSAYGIHVFENGIDYTSEERLDVLSFAFFSDNALVRSRIKEIWEAELSGLVCETLLGDESVVEVNGLRSVLWYANQIALSEGMNYRIWQFEQFPFVVAPEDDYVDNVTALRSWLACRVQWLSLEYGSW